MKIVFCLCAFVFFSVCRPLAAQDFLQGTPKPAPGESSVSDDPAAGSETPVASLTPSRGNKIEMALLAVEMAESSYKIHRDVKSKASLLSSYERIIPLICMPEIFRTLDYQGNPSDQECIDFLTKMFTLQPQNPVAVCAKEGVESPDCGDAYVGQEIKILSESGTSGGRGGSNVDALLDAELYDSKTSPKVEALERQASDLKDAYEQAKSPQNREKLVATYNALARLACDQTKTVFEAGPSQKDAQEIERGKKLNKKVEDIMFGGRRTEPTPTPLVTAAPSDGPLGSLVEKHTPTPAADDVLLRRVVYMSAACARTIELVKQFNPRMAIVVCNQEGFYSPGCIQALRRDREEAAKAREAILKEKSHAAATAGASFTPTIVNEMESF